MAVLASMQSILASPAIGVTSITRFSHLVPPGYLPCQQRNAGLKVSCMAQKMQEEGSSPNPKPKLSTKFSDLFAFSGPAPEIINGRLAMIGFVAAIGVELSSGQDVFAQLSNGGITAFIGTSALLSLASLIPLSKGVSVESQSEGVFTSHAEMWNGRFAMLGLVALAFTEYLKGGALV